jgi:hypothetical protein
MKILNTDFNENKIWTEEEVLKTLKKRNSNTEESELITLIKSSNLVKYELPKNVKSGKKRKSNDKSNDWNADNFSQSGDSQQGTD